MLNEWTETYWTNPWALSFVLVALASVLLELAWRKRWSWAVLFRGVWLALLGFILADYNRVSSKSLSQPENLHILIDRSSSILDLKDRRDRLEGFLQELKTWIDERKQPVQILSFGDQI
jgi:hypothetical protein